MEVGNAHKLSVWVARNMVKMNFYLYGETEGHKSPPFVVYMRCVSLENKRNANERKIDLILNPFLLVRRWKTVCLAHCYANGVRQVASVVDEGMEFELCLGFWRFLGWIGSKFSSWRIFEQFFWIFWLFLSWICAGYSTHWNFEQILLWIGSGWSIRWNVEQFSISLGYFKAESTRIDKFIKFLSNFQFVSTIKRLWLFKSVDFFQFQIIFGVFLTQTDAGFIFFPQNLISKSIQLILDEFLALSFQFSTLFALIFLVVMLSKLLMTSQYRQIRFFPLLGIFFDFCAIFSPFSSNFDFCLLYLSKYFWIFPIFDQF